MNKRSFQTKLRFIVLLFFVLLLIQAFFVIYSIMHSELGALIKDKIITLQIIFMLIEIITGLLLYFYMPILLKKAFKPIENVFKSLSHGKFETRIPEKLKKGPISSLIHSTNTMIENLNKFDRAKKNKIEEYRKRLVLIIQNMKDAAIVVNKNFEIVLINELAKKLLGIISNEEYPSLMDFHFEGEILKYFKEAITHKTKLDERKIYYPKAKKHITFRNGIIHDHNGNFSGMVFIITDIEKNKLIEDSKQDSSE